MLLVIVLFTGWRCGGITRTFIAWLGSWLRDRRKSVEVISDAYSFSVRHRYLRFENLNLFYTSKTWESLRKLKKKTCNPKDIENPHNLRSKNVWWAMKVTNKKLTKLNYPANIFLLLTHIILQLFYVWFQFSKHTSAFLIFKTRNFDILSDWMDLCFE